MKFLAEINESVRIIEEAKEDGKKSLFVEGIFLQAGIKNRNGRMYPTAVLQKECKRYTENYISKNRAFGELNHPQGPTINLDRVSHIIKEVRQEGNNFIGRAKITEHTLAGQTAAGLIRDGAQLGISSRGLGSLKENKEGIMEVQEDFMLVTAGDLVADPSAPDAWLAAVYENRDWVMNVTTGEWTCRVVEDTQKAIKKLTSKQLQEQKLSRFNAFLDSLSKK